MLIFNIFSLTLRNFRLIIIADPLQVIGISGAINISFGIICDVTSLKRRSVSFNLYSISSSSAALLGKLFKIY